MFFSFVHMLEWFEKCRQLWILGGNIRDENLLNLAEDFFDALKVCLYIVYFGYKVDFATEQIVFTFCRRSMSPEVQVCD